MGTIFCLITVEALVPETELDDEDVAISGTYAIGLDDGEIDRERDLRDDETYQEEAALDVLHDRIGIAVLDHFEITTALVDGRAIPEDAHWLI